MKNWQERTQLLLGDEKLNKLAQAHVLVVGLGGVGAYVAEQLARAGIGQLTLVDGDIIEASNRNRQLPALISTTGENKARIMAARISDINPTIQLKVLTAYQEEDSIHRLLQDQTYDYVVDAIDTLGPKMALLKSCLNHETPVISSMGAGGKLDPSQIQLADLSKSHHCKLARMLRKRLHREGIYQGIQVVFSPEEVPEEAVRSEQGRNKKSTVGTISYMPAAFGCFCASAVIRSLINS